MEKEVFQVRFPAGLRAQVAEAARLNGRSMNAEIVLLVQRGLGLMPVLHQGQPLGQPNLPPLDMAKLGDELQKLSAAMKHMADTVDFAAVRKNFRDFVEMAEQNLQQPARHATTSSKTPKE